MLGERGLRTGRFFSHDVDRSNGRIGSPVGGSLPYDLEDWEWFDEVGEGITTQCSEYGNMQEFF